MYRYETYATMISFDTCLLYLIVLLCSRTHYTHFLLVYWIIINKHNLSSILFTNPRWIYADPDLAVCFHTDPDSALQYISMWIRIQALTNTMLECKFNNENKIIKSQKGWLILWVIFSLLSWCNCLVNLVKMNEHS